MFNNTTRTKRTVLATAGAIALALLAAACSSTWSASIAADGTSIITPAMRKPCSAQRSTNQAASSGSATIGAITQGVVAVRRAAEVAERLA